MFVKLSLVYAHTNATQTDISHPGYNDSTTTGTYTTAGPTTTAAPGTALATVTWWLGAGTTSGFADGVGTAAKFYRPRSCVVSANGNDMYVVDYNNYRVRKAVTANGDVTTFAGNGTKATTDGTGTAASFDYPYRLPCVAFHVASLVVRFSLFAFCVLGTVCA